ncbi:glycosyl transferase [Flavobacterium suaedae]|uniref:Glycosyl transferase n=1 Tax=Flavobacterium suaedae TaxID=1767027 RepID=A0ABQ1JT55_9FLAO|nr:glycosyltransferase family 2 protein [Flavobacterium suaedae]GGB76693.1 glycosyl transferase [Flavobacterium suaedae]
MDKKVFVVIVTYNGAKWIDKNITSLLESEYPVNTIVIDNCSTDDSVVLLSKYLEVQLIQSETNLGFGKANNIGIKKALDNGADYIFLLNQDAWVFPKTISSLVNSMETNADYGIISPIHFSGDETTWDESFKTYYNRKTASSGNLVTVPFVNAAAWMMSRACIEKVGLFEPMFSHYGEDRNYCDRVKYHRFLIGIDENASIVHDRVIKRNFKKDVIQSQYKILTTLLNINNSLDKSYRLAFKEVLGLPKYFSKYYGVGKVANLFFKLFSYYIKQVRAKQSIEQVRQKSVSS